MSPVEAVLVCLAGGAGAAARFTVDGLVRARLPGRRVPWGTLLVNVTGSFLLGVLTGLVARGAPGALGAVVGTGFCGGYTTFSTASVEIVRLLREGHLRAAAAYTLGTPVGTLAAAAAGVVLASP